MGWEDRDYYRNQRGPMTPMQWLSSGSVPLFEAFRIRVRAHSTMVIYCALTLIFGLGTGWTWQDRVQNVTVLFAIVLLHEFGHCFAARGVGGEAHDILMHPLGGLAFVSPPHRPLPTFISVAGGPAVNVVICLVCGTLLFSISGWLPWNPFRFANPHRDFGGWLDLWQYAYWIYQISWTLLIFNLLPIFPLDGGRMLQTILWPKFGYYKSMLFSCNTGMVCSVVGGILGIASGNIGLGILAICGFMYCLQIKRVLVANGPQEEPWGDSIDYSAAYVPMRKAKVVQPRKRDVRRAAKIVKQEADEQAAIDAILAKVSTQGMHSLTTAEQKTLHLATEHQKQRDAERKKLRSGR